jgi:hypothetical protein
MVTLAQRELTPVPALSPADRSWPHPTGPGKLPGRGACGVSKGISYRRIFERKEAAVSDVTPIRDPKSDSLLTPQNAVLALIDYQPEQYAGVKSVGPGELLIHVTMLGRIATAFGLPVVLSTVYVKHGMSGTNAQLREALPGVPRSTAPR